jgi:hypothetical protein
VGPTLSLRAFVRVGVNLSVVDTFSSGSFQSESSGFVCRLRISARSYVFRGVHSFRHVVDGLEEIRLLG